MKLDADGDAALHLHVPGEASVIRVR